MTLRVLVLAVAAIIVALAPRAAFACAVCATADPTLTVSGEERPFRNRLRLFGDVRIGEVDAGDVRLSDRRVEIGALWAPTRAFEIAFAAPYLFRRIETASTAIDRATIGDIELRAQLLVYESRGSFGRRRFGLIGSLKLPTSPIAEGVDGTPLASTLQPGCGSIAPTLGAFWSMSRAAWSFYASGSLFLPFSIRDGPHAGDSVRFASHVQYQPHPRFAGRLGIFGRVDSNGELATNIDDPNSGGFIGYVSSEIVVSPAPDLLITLGAFFPVIEALRGVHHESSIGAFTIAYDF